MATREIPRREWMSFFDGFSGEHQQWPTTVETISGDIGDQPEVEGEPLVGISFDPKGSSSGAIEVMVGVRPDNHLTHTITDPTQVWLRDTVEAGDEALEVESADGSKTLIRFGAGTAPLMPGGGS